MTPGAPGNSLSLDPEALRAVATHLEGYGAHAAQILAELREAMAQQGECWGNDDPGEQFAKTYVPSAHQGAEGLHTLAENLDSLGKGVANAVDTVEQQDAINAAAVNNAASNVVSPTSAVTSPRTVTSSPAVNPQTTGPAATGTPASANPVRPGSPGKRATSSQPLSNRQPTTAQQPTAQQPASQQSSPRQASPQQPASEQPSSQQPTSRRPDGSPQPANRGAVTAGTNSGAPVSATPNRPARPGPTTATPWSKSSAPASSAAGPGTPAAPRGSAQPPRVSAPEEPDEHPRQPPRGQPGSGKGAKRRKSEAAGRSDESPNARIARELAERHGIEVMSFALPGVDEETVREFAAAVDDVLGKYPNIGLRGVGIADLGDAAAQTDWDDGARILLGLAAALDPAGYARSISAATEVGYLVRGCADRPVYSTIVREFGRVLDTAGGLRARRAAQKALITEYMRVVAPDYRLDPLGRTVAGYREWRGRFSGCCFPGGQFDAGSAVAEAFVETELHGQEAGAQAAALHRLLVAALPGPNPDMPSGGSPSGAPTER